MTFTASISSKLTSSFGVVYSVENDSISRPTISNTTSQAHPVVITGQV